MMEKVDLTEFLKKMDALADAYGKLPAQIAAIAVNFSKERFVDQTWLDTARQPWKERARRRKGGKKKSQTLLVDTGRLKRSIRKISADRNTVVVGTDVPYAQIQNDGGDINKSVLVKSHTRKAYTRKRKGRKETVKSHKVKLHARKMNVKIPARTFIGQSEELNQRIISFAVAALEDALNQILKGEDCTYTIKNRHIIAS